MNEKVFETLLEEASRESFRNMLDALPTEEELSDFTVPETLQNALNHTIKKERKVLKLKKLMKVSRRVAACAVIALTVSCGALMSIDAYREVIIDTVLNWGTDSVDVVLGSEAEETKQQSEYKPSYIPEGYEEESSNSIPNFLHVKYINEEGSRVVFASFVKDEDMSATISIDTTHTTYYPMEYNGIPLKVFQAKGEAYCSYVFWDTDQYLFRVYGKLPLMELVKMIESIQS